MGLIGRKKPVDLDALDPAARAAEEARRAANVAKTKASRERRAAKLAELAERERRHEEAATQKLIEREDDSKRKLQIKEWLDQGLSADEIRVYENEQDLATLLHSAFVQATGNPSCFSEPGMATLAVLHRYFPDKAEWKVQLDHDEKTGFYRPQVIDHIVQPLSSDQLADIQVSLAEAKFKYDWIRQQRASGLVLEDNKLLSPRWLAWSGRLVDYRMAAIETWLKAQVGFEFEPLWNFAESRTDPYGCSRPWQSWKWTPVERPEPPKPEPAKAPVKIDPPPVSAEDASMASTRMN
jgi:hypothetical protein